MNKVQIIGRITKDVQTRQVQASNGTISCAQFVVAVNRKFKDKDGNYPADFINCVAWRQQADFISKYFGKGSKIAICGTIQTRSYDDKNGNKVFVTEVLVEDAEFVESKQTSKPAEPPKAPAVQIAPSMEEFDDDPLADMPFQI